MSTLDKFLLNDKVAFVTGGAGLLGKQHGIALLDAGAKVVFADINVDSLRSLKSELVNSYPLDNMEFLDCNIIEESSILSAQQSIMKRWGKSPDILINNAAIDPKADKAKNDLNMSRLENFSIEQWDLELNVGIRGAFLCTKVFGPHMVKSGGGVILNISSDLGVIAPDQRLYRKEGVPEDLQNVKPVTYSVIKHALIGLTKYVATYWAKDGVRCNALAPAGVFNDHPKDFEEKLNDRIPMQRMACIDEYRAAIVYLSSDASSYVNGSTHIIDGGRSIW
jgi:NAD(P)-dependent dehydrogenase (short-subunit alcohol dehydrogenase family)